MLSLLQIQSAEIFGKNYSANQIFQPKNGEISLVFAKDALYSYSALEKGSFPKLKPIQSDNIEVLI
jgi:hypothetical protein